MQCHYNNVSLRETHNSHGIHLFKVYSFNGHLNVKQVSLVPKSCQMEWHVLCHRFSTGKRNQTIFGGTVLKIENMCE